MNDLVPFLNYYVSVSESLPNNTGLVNINLLINARNTF